MENYPEKIDQVEYSESELQYRGYLIERMEQSRGMRESPHDEFDGMSYTEYYESNQRAARSYIPPKRNPKDIRIVTGVTENKLEAMLSNLLNFNLEPNVTAYEKNNNEIVELGENVEALIRKSREIETPDYDVKRPLIYKEFLEQGTVFIQESLIEWQEVEKVLKKGKDWAEGVNMSIIWESSKAKTHRECRSQLLSGPNVYLGNIKDFYIDSQPYIFVRDYITYEEAKRLFGTWSRFKHVSAIVQNFSTPGESRLYNDWTLLEQEEGFVEVLKYYDKPNNELQIMLNGVMMLPQGFPLSCLLGKNVYPIVKGDMNPISKYFAYSKSYPARTKIDQQMLDEFYKLFIRKTQKSVAPSLANNTGRELTSKIFDAAEITNDVNPMMLQEIGKNDGVTQAEFQFFELLKRTIDSKSISPVMEGQSPTGNQTATEIVEMKKQSMQKLGLAVWGIMNLEEGMSWLRMYNLINSWTKEQDTRVDKIKGKIEDVFMKVEVEDTMGDGSPGTRVINFTENPPSSVQIKAHEDLLLHRGKKIKQVYLNPKLLREMDITWKITIVPTEKDSDAIDRAQFTNDISEGYQLFGPQEFNKEYVKTVWAQKRKLDKDQLYAKPQVMPPEQMPQQQGQGSVAGGGPNSINNMLRQANRAAPNINSLVKR